MKAQCLQLWQKGTVLVYVCTYAMKAGIPKTQSLNIADYGREFHHRQMENLQN